MTRMLNYVQAIAEGLIQAMEQDDRVFLMGEGVDRVTGIYGITLPAFERFGERRLIDAPLSENGLTGFAVGAAMNGLRPVLFHQRDDFMLLAMDQLNQAAKIPYISAGQHQVPLTIVTIVSKKLGEGGLHNQSLQALFAHIPGLKVVMPADAYDAKGMLLSAIKDNGPVLVMYHRDLFEDSTDVPVESYEVALGPARLGRIGADVTIVSVSTTVKTTLAAANHLAEEGVDTEVIDLRSIRPFDGEMILNSVKKTGRLVVVDTSWRLFGISAEIVAFVAEWGLGLLKAPPQRVGMLDTPLPPAAPHLISEYHPSEGLIIEAIRRVIR